MPNTYLITGLWFSKGGVFNLSTIGIWGLIIYCSERYFPVHCELFSSIPGLYSLDARSFILPPSPGHDNQISSDITRCPQVEKGKVSPDWEPLSKGHSSLFSAIQLLIMYYHKFIYSKIIISHVGLLMISLFVPDKALHNVVLCYFSDIFFAFNLLCYSLTSLFAFV